MTDVGGKCFGVTVELSDDHQLVLTVAGFSLGLDRAQVSLSPHDARKLASTLLRQADKAENQGKLNQAPRARIKRRKPIG